jgi:hypothetical protein
MSCCLTADCELNFPRPTIELAIIHVRQLFDGVAPVTTKAVAESIGCDALAVDNMLKRAAYSGRIREVRGRGWMPLAI